MSTQEHATVNLLILDKFLKSKRSRVICTAIFLCALLLSVLSLIVMRSPHFSHAAGTNIAEDNFQRADTTVGWGTTTNNDGLTNYVWQRSLNNTPQAFINANNGVIVYAGINGHKIAGYVKVPVQSSGDALARITFTATGHAVGGVMLLVTGGTSWYQGDMNTSTKTLEIRKRLNGIMTTVASIPFVYTANTPYWIRLDVQTTSGAAVVTENAWADGTTEPITPLATYTDTAPLAAGCAGAMSDWFKTPSPGEQVRFSSWSYTTQGLATPAQ